MKPYPDYLEEDVRRFERILSNLDDEEFEKHSLDELFEKYATDEYKKWEKEYTKRKEEAWKKGIIIN